MNIQIQPRSDDNTLSNIFLFPRITAKYIAEIMCVYVKNHCSIDMYILKLCTIICGVYIMFEPDYKRLKLLLCYESDM